MNSTKDPLRRALAAALLVCGLGAVPCAGAPVPDDPWAERGYVGVLVGGGSYRLIVRHDGTLVSLAARLGDEVAAGQTIARLDDRDARAALDSARASRDAGLADEQRAQAELAVARERLARREDAKDLVSAEERALAREQVRMAEAELARQHAELARLEVDVAAAEDALRATRLSATAAGVVRALPARVGQRVSAGQAIAEIAGEGQVRVRFAVPLAQASRFAIGAAVAVEADGVPGEARAVVTRIAPAVDDASGLLFIEADLATDEGAFNSSAGSTVRVRAR